ncbi:hypothetical protein TBLA_0A01590 [Henningerozyma blattae CBS 6284]|uniref:NAD-dependent epimerase/dehydratase domain-containing protein n=1 Tax=Henningerozyma blattae (strain ATCC 34711 / CBS 6284 / DSM 70876 / NBRC 10599 / NRRL Y-10934 / UCD 77-7) TaxID=1071380 RepID=I2GV06_HENB6|nr:hypothetical protein TBLA_0A01590 [Tetrapisispora blattae CBS 6284]CCH57958.1 hypothetical protein TBLA_0A01590 [Tetrapisispora blattae CBS 6284]
MSVLVTGATGFIAQHIVDALLKENYNVIGTARSQAKADNLLASFNSPNLSMEIVSDISDLNAFDDIFKAHANKIKYVLHTASPFHFNTTDYSKDLFIPAKNGTLGILQSIKKYAPQTVERVVVTSSQAATLDFTAPPSSKTVYTEKSWNPANEETKQMNAIMAYCTSKKIAEKAAWDFYNENKSQLKFKLSIVNPVFVFGPQLFDSSVSATLNTSCEVINQVLKTTPKDQLKKDVMGEFIDVRDVARAHLDAFTKEETIEKRLLMNNGLFSEITIGNIINNDFPQYKGKIAPVADDTDLQNDIAPYKCDNSVTKQILGWEFTSLQKSVDDTVAQILKMSK